MALFWLNKESFFNDAVVPSNSSVNLTVEADPWLCSLDASLHRSGDVYPNAVAVRLGPLPVAAGAHFRDPVRLVDCESDAKFTKEITLAKVNQSVAWSDAAGPSPLADRIDHRHVDLDINTESISKKLPSLKRIDKLSQIVKENQLKIEAGGLFHFSRASLLTIVTTVVTTLLVTKEILSRSVEACPSKG
ncbi:hypothetical protein BV898_17199 [Hypsibius exemplaris]|uniref:Uncharacterized protein n=1 Tax=Hypsibius exemplaris TaxID=2072580 RepID=A0A9X6NHM2_HYPEX|nr:hypothetical protein BV898_17199 [Hypsibius exemplaris]